MVLPVRIELTTSALPRMRSTTELRQHDRHGPSAPASKAGPMALQCPACQGESRDRSARRRAASTIIRDSSGTNALHLGAWPNMTRSANAASPRPCAPICAGARPAAAPHPTPPTIRPRTKPPRAIKPDSSQGLIVEPRSAPGELRQPRSRHRAKSRDRFSEQAMRQQKPRTVGRGDDAGQASAATPLRASDACLNSHLQHGPA